MTELAEKQSLPGIPIPPKAGIRYFPNAEDSADDPEYAAGSQNQSDTESLPPQSFFSLLKGIIVSNYKAFPKRIVKDIIWVGPLLAVWIGLWTIPYMTVQSLPGPLSSLAMALIFLTATYNGLVGKAAFITVISRTFIPLVKRIRGGELAQIKEKYAQTATIIKKAMAKSKMLTLELFLISGGLGLAASNILTRNNKIDKYLICVLCAVALFNDLSKGKNSPVVRLVSTGLRDMPVLAGMRLKVTLASSYLVITGFAIGLLLALLPSLFFNSYSSPGGFIFGAIFVIAGIAVHFVGGKNAVK